MVWYLIIIRSLIWNIIHLIIYKVLKKLRGSGSDDLVEQEINDLKEEKDALNRQNKVNWLDLFRNKKYSRPLGVALAIMVCQQISGINAVIFF